MSKILISVVASLLFNTVSLADSLDVLEGHEDETPKKGSKFIPYAFYNDTTDAAIAGAYVAQGYFSLK